MNNYDLLILLGQIISVILATIFNAQVETLRNHDTKLYSWFYKWAVLEKGWKNSFGMWWIEDRSERVGAFKKIVLFPLIDGFNAAKFIMIGFYNITILLPFILNKDLFMAITIFVVLTYIMKIILGFYYSMRHKKWTSSQT